MGLDKIIIILHNLIIERGVCVANINYHLGNNQESTHQKKKRSGLFVIIGFDTTNEIGYIGILTTLFHERSAENVHW